MLKLALDAGHGGKDPGAVGNGLQEKHITLDVTKRVQRILLSEYTGVQVFLTRDSDVYISPEERAKMVNEWGADFFLSIHVNAGGGTGFESLRYTNASSRSIAYQNVIHDEIVKHIGVTNRGKKTKNIAVLRETKMPALLTENLFIDTLNDAKLLKDPAFLEKLAWAHCIGLEKAFGIKRKAQVKPGPFPDVPSTHWAAEAIRIVRDAGLMTGREDGTFGPNEPVTRAQLAAIFARLLSQD